MNISEIFLRPKDPNSQKKKQEFIRSTRNPFSSKTGYQKKKNQMHDAWFNSKSKRTPSKVALWRPLSQGLLDHIINKIA